MKKLWRMLLQRKKLLISFTFVLVLWGLAVVDSFGNVFVWETFLPEISKKLENKEEEAKELFERCQGEEVMDYYEGMGSTSIKDNVYGEDIKAWIELGLKESFPDEEWNVKEYPKEKIGSKRELHIENKSQTISGKVRVCNNKEEKDYKKYFHFVFNSKGREDSLYGLKQVWNKKVKEINIIDYKDYYYRTFCFRGRLTLGEQKQAAKQYCQHFGVKKVKESVIEDMENVYGYTENIQDSTIVEGEKMNFHIAFMYDEIEDNTHLYLATPFLNTDY